MMLFIFGVFIGVTISFGVLALLNAASDDD